MGVTTWNTAPDYDQWGMDTSWKCSDWILWHKYLKEKFGQNKANFIWDYAFALSGQLSSNLDCRTFDSSFRAYVNENKLNPYANAGIFQPVLQGVGTIQDVSIGALGGISSFFSGKNFKLILNVLVIGGIAFTGFYAYKNLKK